MKKRILSLILAFAMAATLAPATALVGSSTAKAADVTNVIIKEVADNEYPAKTWATAADDLKAPTGDSISSLTVTAARGTKNTVKYLKSNIPWADASDNNNAGAAARYVQFAPISSQTTRAGWIGLPNFTFEARSANAEIKDATNATGFVASVAELTFDVPKTTPAGTYEVTYKPALTGTGASTDKVDLDGDGDTSNDEFVITVVVTDPVDTWTTFSATESAANVDGKVLDGVVDTAKTITVSNTLTPAYTSIKATTDFQASDIVTKIAAEKPADCTVTGSGTPGGSPSLTAKVNTGSPNGIYYFNITQELGGVVLHSARFGIRVGEGATVTLDPKGGAIYDAEFEKKGDLYVGEFGKQAGLFTVDGGTKPLPTPIREDMIFDGWYIDNSNTKLTTPVSTALGDVAYYAKWTDKAPTITLASGVAGVGNSSTGTIKLGDKLASKTNVLERQGYDLLGWSVRPNATIVQYSVMDTVTVDMVKTIQAANNANTLYAVWKAKSFKISFDPGIPGGQKLSEYSATSMDPITWSTDEEMTFGEWKAATKNKFHIWGYKFVGWSAHMGVGNTGGDATKAVLDERTDKEFATSSLNVIDVADLQNPSGIDITLYAVWESKVASYITLKEETGKELNAIHDINTKAPDEAGRIGYFVEKWTEGTDEWLPESDPNSTAVNKRMAVLTPKFRTEGIKYNMILANTKEDDYHLGTVAGTATNPSNIDELQGDSHLQTFSADQKTVLLPDRKTTDSAVATFVGYEAWVESAAGGVTIASVKSAVSGWTKLPGIYKGSFNSLDIIKAIEAEDPTNSWTNNDSTGVVFFYPVWKYNLADAMLIDTVGTPVNSQNIVVNYGTSMATIQNMLAARFYVKKNNQLTPIWVPSVLADITLSGSYDPLKAGRYNLKATIVPNNTVNALSASFTKDVVVEVRNKVASGFAEDAVVAAGFTPVSDINLPAGSNVQDILAALAKVYRVEVLGDNSQKYSLELAEVVNANMEWAFDVTSTNYNKNVVDATNAATITFDNDEFKTAYSSGTGTTKFTNKTFRFALPVVDALKSANATETGRNAGTMEYIGYDRTAATTTEQNGNKYLIVDVNVGAGNKPVVTPVTPDVEETNPDRPAIAAGPVYVLYNKNNGDHYYTADKAQRDALVVMGLQADDVTFYTPSSTDANAKPVYALYNPNSGEHFYTMSKGERNKLVNVDKWQYHGVQFYAYSKNSKLGSPIYRLFNPNATDAGSHYLTGSKGVYNKLASIGWNKEGVAFRAVKAN